MSSTTIITNVGSSDITQYNHAYAQVYGNSLDPLVYPSVDNDQEALSLYNKNGKTLYCVYGSQDKGSYIKLKVSENKTGHRFVTDPTSTIGHYFIYPDGTFSSSPASALCVESLSQDQESNLERLVNREVSFSELLHEDLEGLFGDVHETYFHLNTLNTIYKFPKNCENSCPQGQCDGSVAETFTVTSVSHGISKTTHCRRVAAVYLRGNVGGHSGGYILSNDEIKRIENPCGLPVECGVSSLSHYPSVIRFTVDTAFLVGDAVDGMVSVNLHDVLPLLTCYQNPPNTTLIPERVVYVDGECSEFESNRCLHRGYNEIDGITLEGTKISNTTIVTNREIDQKCPEPICSSDYCIQLPVNSSVDTTIVSQTPTELQSQSSESNIGIIGGVIGGTAFLILSLGIGFAIICSILNREKIKYICRKIFICCKKSESRDLRQQHPNIAMR